MKARNVFVTFILVSVVLALLVSVSGATWCNNDYAKRINVSVNNTGGAALTDYQVYVNLNSNPINESSIRVYNSTGCTLRPHWCENTTSGNCTKLWINYSSVAASAWTNNTAIYYDNATVSSASNITTTFVFGDDFSVDVDVNLIAEPTNPTRIVDDAWEALAIVEQSDFNYGGEYISWYRSNTSGNQAVGFENSTDGITWNPDSGNPIISSTALYVYVVQDGDCFYLFKNTDSNGYGSIYLYNVTDHTNPVIMNGGNPVYTRSSTTTDWDWRIFNPGVSIDSDGVWHMLLEGQSNAGVFRLGYAYSNLTEMNWSKHRSSSYVINTAGNPYLKYVPDRNALLALYGDISGSYWKVISSCANLSDDLSLSASWYSSLNFEIAHSGIHTADPHAMFNFNATYPTMISYNYNQASIYQTYSALALNEFYDVITTEAFEKWNTYGTSTNTVKDGILNITSVSDNWGIFIGKTSVSMPNIIEAWAKVAAADDRARVAFSSDIDTTSTNLVAWWWAHGTSNPYVAAYVGGSGGYTQLGEALNHVNYHRYKIEWISGIANFYYDSVYKANRTTNIPTSDLPAWMLSGTGGDVIGYWDWIFVRKYTSVEPSTTLGNEEQQAGGTTPIISNVQNGSISPTSQWIDWNVNQTAHNRVLYSNQSDLTPAWYSTWNNSTNAPNITLSALTASTQYWYQAWSYNTTNTSLSDNSSTLSFTTAATAEPVITLLSQTPSQLFQNSTGHFNQTWGISHNSTGLNNSTLTYIYHNIYDSDAHHSLRLPINDRALPDGWRGDNRNESGVTRLTQEGNTTIFGSDYWTWSGLDYNKSQMSIETVNSTYTKIHINSSTQCMIFSNSWYLNHKELDSAAKTVYDIKKQSQLLVEIYDTEMMRNRDRNYTVSIWIDTVDNPTDILYPIEIWWANASFDPTAGTALTASPYAVKMMDMTDDDWETRQYNTTNSHYMRFNIYAGADPVILPTNESYLLFKHDYPRPYKLNVTNVATITNRSFAQTNVSWTSSFDHPAVYTPYSYTPNIFLTFHRGNQTFESKLWVADNNSLWGNSSLEQSDIGQSNFPPTPGSFEHFVFYGYNDTTMDCTYRGNISVYLQTGRDADGGNCTNNLTLCYTNGTYVATINNTFNTTVNDYIRTINFNTTPYYSTTDLYTLKLVTTDDEFDSVTTDLPVVFSLSPLGTTGALYDSRPYAGRLTFWGIPNIPFGCTTANNPNLIEYNATTDEYILKTSLHQSQYGDTFYANETTRIVSYNNDSTPFYRWTGNQVTTNMTTTSWNATTQSPVTSAEEFRTYVYSDPFYSRVNVKNSNLSYLGNGQIPYRGVYIGCGEDAVIDNNTFMHNDQGLSVWGGGNFTISNNTVIDPIDHSISLYNISGNITVRDNVITSDVEARGISTIHGGAGNEYINNTITGSAQSGLYNQYITDSVFRDNTMNNVQNGIVLSKECDNITIKDNNITVEMDVHGHPAWGITIMSGTHNVYNNTINATNGYGIVMSNLYTSIPCINSIMINNSIKTTQGTHTDAGVFADYVLNMNSTGNIIRDPQDTTNSISINNDISDIRIENTDNAVFSEDSAHRTYAYLTNFSLYADTNESFNITQRNMTALPSTDKLSMWNVEWDATVKFNASSVTGVNPTWYNITNATWTTETIDIYRNNSLFSNEVADANGTITYNYSDSYSQKYFEFQVQSAAANYTPPDPTTLANTTGNFWVNHTWNNGTGNITNSYNVSVNLTWYNTTTNKYYNNTGLPAHNWSNVTVWAYNSSGNGTLSTGNISQNTQIPNNVPVLNGLPDNTTDEDVNQTDIFDLDSYFTDADGDAPTYLVESNNQSAYVSVTINASNNVSYTLASGWNGTASVVINVTDGWGGEDNDTFLIIVNAAPLPGDYIPDDPTNLQNTTGNYWVNYTWNVGGGNITDSYNVSWNLTWYNTTTDTFMKKEVGASNWANITVYAFNSSGNGTLSTGYISDEVQAPAFVPGDYVPPNPTTLLNTTGNYYVNYTWVMGVPGNITDSYNVSWNLSWFNGTLTAYMQKEVGASNWGNITVYAFNSSGNGSLSVGSISDNVQAPAYVPGDYPPATPTFLTNTTGNGWVNYTWSSGGGANVTDSYNISWNLSWHNTTLVTYMNDTVGEFGWANISVWAFNSSGNGSLSVGSISDNTQADGGMFTTSMGTTLYNLITYYGSATSTAEQFGLDIGSVDYIALYNGSFYTHTMGFAANNFTTYHGIGYYVYLNASGSPTYQRNNISDVPYNTQLFNRWNTIGWTNTTDTNAESVASSIGSACKYTSSLNADGVTYTTHTVGFTSNNHAVEKGEGYWVWVNTGVNWGRNS